MKDKDKTILILQEYTCGTGLCIHAGWVCDGEEDCSDGWVIN